MHESTQSIHSTFTPYLPHLPQLLLQQPETILHIIVPHFPFQHRPQLYLEIIFTVAVNFAQDSQMAGMRNSQNRNNFIIPV